MMCARALAAVLLLAQPVAAENFVTERLAGELLLGGAHLVDPPLGEPAGTHAYLTITGAAARRMFNAMPGPDRAGLCQPGRRSRQAGNLTCSIGPRTEARCDVALLVGRGETAPGRPC
jgi:hypothetical protein